MANEKVDSRVLEPDLICSKNGEVLERSAREDFRAFEEISSFLLPRLLRHLLEIRRF